MFVRYEERQGVAGRLLVGVDNRVVVTRWTPNTEAVEGELVNDTAGRAEGAFFLLECEQVKRKHDAMQQAMRQAVAWLSPTQAEDLRELYRKTLKEMS